MTEADETMVARFAQARARDVEPAGWARLDADGLLDFSDAEVRPTQADIDYLPVGSAYVPVYPQAAIDTLRAQLEAAEAEIRAVWQSMPVGRLYLDPPDGGDVPLHEQVRRMGEEVIAQESRGDLAIADLSRLRAVVKAFYNQTIADTTVRISCKSSAVRDRVDALVRELRPLLEDTRKEQPAARTKEAAP